MENQMPSLTANTEKSIGAPAIASGRLASAEEIIDEARNGRMFILVDDEDRENEGDLIMPAQMVTPDAVNFMAKYGRGLICLAMTKERTDQLGLGLMSHNNATRHETAFTVSIEAKTGVTTGISAADRARTIAAAINGTNGRDDIVTPGHVFPLIAQPGGVLIRAGHTEAAVDVSRLAGLNPSGVICEITNDDGTMARLEQLVPFADKHNLKIGTIRDLIAYRRLNDHLVERAFETSFISIYGGEWKVIVYRNTIDGSENIVLQKGEVSEGRPTLVRMHGVSLLDDMLGRGNSEDRILKKSMEAIGEQGHGLIVLLGPTGPGAFKRIVDRSKGDEDMDLRTYGAGAQILADLGINDMILLSNTQRNIVAIKGWGLNVVGTSEVG